MSAPTKPTYVADTHSLVWYLLDSPRLSTAADRAFRAVEADEARLLVPAIVIAELIFIVERGKLLADIDELLRRIEAASNFELRALEWKQLKCLKEQKTIMTMHDRLIVCEALLNNASLITQDEEIRSSGIVPVVW